MADYYPEDTVPRLLRSRAQRNPDDVAIRVKEFGIWAPMTWAEYQRRVREFALGLLELGMEPGDTIAVLGDNRAEWLIADLAAQALGGAGVALFSESLQDEVKHIITHCGATVVLVEDQEQLDKLVELSASLPNVKILVYLDGRGLHSYDIANLYQIGEVERLGSERDRRDPEEFDRFLEKGDPDDPALILYTSGTTGNPKGAVITHRGLLAACGAIFDVEPVDESFDRLVFLPLAWGGERYFATGGHVVYGYKLNFAEEPDTLRLDLREIGPQHLIGAPRLWEDLHSSVEVRMREASRLKRWLYRWGMKVGGRRADLAAKGDEPGPMLRIKDAVANLLIFRPLRDQLGLLRAKRVYSGGAAIGADVTRWYHSIRVNLKQIYGQTECGIVTVHYGLIKPETMGETIPHVQIKISEENEVLVAGDTIFDGYYNNPDATAAAVIDGWLHTGDEGYFDDDNHLVILDRMSHVSELVSGDRFSPTLIENKLKFSPYVQEAVCFGHGRDFVVAVVQIDGETVGKWAEERRVVYTTYADLTQKPEVIDLVRQEVNRANEDLPRPMNVVRFAVLYKEFDADDDEVTRTRKVKRTLIEQRYEAIIEALFAGEEMVAVESEISYSDGRRRTMRTNLRLNDAAVSAQLEEAGR